MYKDYIEQFRLIIRILKIKILICSMNQSALSIIPSAHWKKKYILSSNQRIVLRARDYSPNPILRPTFQKQATVATKPTGIFLN